MLPQPSRQVKACKAGGKQTQIIEDAKQTDER